MENRVIAVILDGKPVKVEDMTLDQARHAIQVLGFELECIRIIATRRCIQEVKLSAHV